MSTSEDNPPQEPKSEATSEVNGNHSAVIVPTGRQYYLDLDDPSVIQQIQQQIGALGLHQQIAQAILNVIGNWIQFQPRLVGPRPRMSQTGGIPVSIEDLMQPFLEAHMKAEAMARAEKPQADEQDTPPAPRRKLDG